MPNPASRSSAPSPSTGDGAAGAGGVPENFAAGRGTLMRPTCGWSTSRNSSFSTTCGSVSTSLRVRIFAQGTSSASRAAIHSADVRCRMTLPTMPRRESAFEIRPAAVL